MQSYKGYADTYVQPTYNTAYNTYQRPEAQSNTYQQSGAQYNTYQQPGAQYNTYQQPGEEYNTYQQPAAQYNTYQQPEAQYNPYQQPVAQYNTHQQPMTQYNYSPDKNSRMIFVVGLILRIMVIAGIPFTLYKCFTTFPVNVIQLFKSLFTFNFKSLFAQTANIFNPYSYVKSLSWAFAGVLIAIVFMAYCYAKDYFGEGFSMGEMLPMILGKLAPKMFSFMIPFVGQGMLVFELFTCFFKF